MLFTPSLSVIIPFRFDKKQPYLLDRLNEQCSHFDTKNRNLEFIVVDSGTCKNDRIKCQSICNNHGVSYIYHDSEGSTFSIGAARDFGVSYARGKAITFLDVDLRTSSDFWSRLIDFMSVYGITKDKKKFFAIPCLYLTEEGTKEFISTENNSKYMDYYLRWLHGDSVAIQNMASCSSVMVVDRLHYLSIGGHRPEFRGHGYEDFELYHRLLGEENSLPRADDYYTDTKSWDTSTYRGFRSQLSLLGRAAQLSNLYVIHLWHPRPKDSSFYSNMSVNRDIWMDFFKYFDKTKNHPEPLTANESLYKKVLFFGKPETNASRTLKDIFPLVGSRIYVSEYDFVDKEGRVDESAFEQLLKNHNIDAVVFPNPYGNMARNAIYLWCRSKGIKYLCYERGALPDSWFFDPNGFNAESSSYSIKNWNKELTVNECEDVKKYISKILNSSNALEKQGARIGGEGLASQLKIGGRKVLFVPLQRPSDTVIQYFRGNLESYDKFLEFIDLTAMALKKEGWVVLCKKHPLETSSPELKYASYVPEDTHFIDLIELADSVALINSGVGVYSMMMGKPCFVFGDSFYSIDGVNVNIDTYDVDTFCKKIRTFTRIDMDKVYKFIHYLTTEFYSFGTPVIEVRKEKDGSLRSITTAIDFYKINLLGKVRYTYENSHVRKLSTSAPIFERFNLDFHIKKKNASQQKTKSNIIKTPAKSAAIPKAVVTENPSAAGLNTPVNKGLSLDKKSVFVAKKNKLLRDPRAFFADSKISLLKPLRFIIK
ncbi:glycosyltransferase [Aeromonas veronii]|uniref:glycosyltransferase n=1 Tax=Aeromonas veronii TaxID=654 RepID=UPI001C588519